LKKDRSEGAGKAPQAKKTIIKKAPLKGVAS
jgi:hypothetical protein